MVSWLLGAGLGPAAVAVPVNWAADALAGAAQRWFKRLRRTDDLSRLVRAATGTSVDLTQAEFDAVRKLLEDQQTWNVAGRGTVGDLATRIAACLPPRDGRTADDAHAAALTIARGLIEFAVADLEPKLFQQVLLARLQRMETGQASELDKALLGLHARFDSVMDQLKLVLDRLPPGPAGRGEIAVYLRTLIDWLSSDPWPRDPQFGGSVLTPAAIERKLRVTATGRVREQDLDADGLAQQCVRLVILGGPGSGKTWLARRTARRCAEDALEVLAAGGTLEEVELPLYTTCSRLFGAGGDIREAVVSSALGQIGDLGGSRISKALGVFFAERNAPTLLVIDSLDEAHGPSERLRQASTLPWRIVLTSRPSSWRHQLTVNDTDESHRVGELQPLDYPGDVEPFIERWFAGQPEQGNDLAAQIARRPGLQQAATVPLMLAFYCIVGGTGPLPDFRRDLYTKVLNRMLTGRWRDDDDRQPDAGTCLQTLRAWAWDGATSHPVSGVGTWADDIPAKRVRLGEADAHAVDHIATPLGPPDVDTGTTLRRFIHRSIREHLVAGHVARLPVDQAVKVLLPHLWYDPDWEYAAPAALAMHPQHDQLLRDLICQAASSDHIPGDLSVIDAGWQVRGLLARVAAESSESDWSPEIAGMIGQARVELAQSGRFWDLGGAAHWGTSDRQARDALLGLLARETDSVDGRRAGGRAGPARPDGGGQAPGPRRAARAAGPRDRQLGGRMAGGRVGPARDDGGGQAPGPRRAARAAGPRDRQRRAAKLAGGLVPLDPTAEDRRQARDALLGLLARETDSGMAAELAAGLVPLDPTAEDRRQARDALLGLLARETDSGRAAELAGELVPLDPTAEDGARPATRCSGCWPARPTAGGPDGWRASWSCSTRRRRTGARPATRCSGCWPARPTASGPIGWPTSWSRSRRRRRTGARPATRCSGCWPARPTAGGPRGWRTSWSRSTRRRRTGARPATRCSGCWPARPTAGGPDGWRAGWSRSTRRRRTGARPATRCSGCWPARPTACMAAELAAGLVPLATTAEDRRQARDALLGLLARETDSGRAADCAGLAGGLVPLDPTAEDRRQARDALLGLLARATDGRRADGWRTSWSCSTRRRRTGARPATRCSGCWPARPTAGGPDGWRAGWSCSTRRRRTGARPATRCSPA